MFVWLREGGVFTWLLLGLSVVALAYTLDRFWALRRHRVMPPGLLNRLDTAEPTVLQRVCLAQSSPLARLVQTVLNHLEWSKKENTAAMVVQARREVIELERGLVVLEIIVGTAPLLGLVGTVYGIVPLFADFGKAISGDSTLLAKGIGIALHKTLLGLMVAIPTLVAWSLFQRRVEVLSVEMETVCDQLQRRFYSEPRNSGTNENPTRSP
jgi:biopolymer transport protein ExbB